MNEEFDYKQVHFQYIHCFNAGCTKADVCLRYLAGQHVPHTLPYLMCVNPATYPTGKATCTHFRTTEKIRLAWGLKNICDNVSYRTACAIRKQVKTLFTKSTYYRILHEERALTPADQRAIAQVFVRHGVTTSPTYTRYTEEYDWEVFNERR